MIHGTRHLWKRPCFSRTVAPFGATPRTCTPCRSRAVQARGPDSGDASVLNGEFMGDVRWWNGLKECSSKGFTLVSVGISLDRFLATLSSVNASCLPPSDTRTIRNRTQPRPVLWCSSARVSLYAFEPPHGQRARRWHSESRVALTGTERWPILFMKATFALGLRLCFHYYF